MVIKNNALTFVVFEINVKVLSGSVHSGYAGGIVPDPFHVIRCLLDRIDYSRTGKVIDELQVKIPEASQKQIDVMSEVLCDGYYNKFDQIGPKLPYDSHSEKVKIAKEIILKNTWKTTLAVVGADGIPSFKEPDNVFRPESTIRASMRLAPTLDAEEAKKKILTLLTENPPFGAEITIKPNVAATGMVCPELSQSLVKTLNNASLQFYGKEMMQLATGGTIPIAMVFSKKVISFI